MEAASRNISKNKKEQACLPGQHQNIFNTLKEDIKWIKKKSLKRCTDAA